jgi:hypothetical protein
VRRIHLRFALSLLATFAAVSSAAAEDAAGVRDAQKAFFENVKKLCGESFEGVTEFPPDPDHDFAGKKLVMFIETCTEEEIRIPFRVGDDTSRTWVLTLSDKGLLLKHDHRDPDGTPHEQTMYGGWAGKDGTALQQHFAADEHTAKLIPDAATNVWTLTISEDEQQFRYALERHAKPRYSAILKRTKRE